jgi:hypothetical protein
VREAWPKVGANARRDDKGDRGILPGGVGVQSRVALTKRGGA